jgi:hypothetical protein
MVQIEGRAFGFCLECTFCLSAEGALKFFSGVKRSFCMNSIETWRLSILPEKLMKNSLRDLHKERKDGQVAA